MLFKVLKILAKGGIYSNQSAARELQVDESLVEQMILQLEQLGYIEKDDMGKDASGCNCESGCSKKGSCCESVNISIKAWKITVKGREHV